MALLDRLQSTTFDSNVLTDPAVAPALAAVDELDALGQEHVDALAGIKASEDYTEAGKAKMVEQQIAAYDQKVAERQASLVKAVEDQEAKVAALVQAELAKDKPKAAGPTDGLEASFKMEELKHLAPTGFVDAYQASLASGDYIGRRAAEAVAGLVLKDSTSDKARFEALRRSFYAPSSPAIESAKAKLSHLRKLANLGGYLVNHVRERGKVAFK